ncbi:site-specific integrase [Colwellia sp. E2M01]|uniref:site-specific integrase n=1 Tax=Colwellia sp. E2M01 TaxID=2841561 RepID=UPI001C09EBB3|nr:site-specific integrase [Colwellia sp. E2M01]MBU2871042.1 site-specific integrase [Colwellia sp. E2M01]
MNPIIILKNDAFTPFESEDGAGEKKRKIVRNNQNKRAIKKGIIIFEKLFPKAFLPEPLLVDFTTQWEKFFLSLARELPGKKDLKIAHDAIAKAIDLGTKKGLWSVSITTHISVLRREKPFKNKNWFTNAKILQKFESNWLANITTTNDSTELLTRCIYSAMFHSGLNDPLHINALLNSLKQKQPIHHKGGHYWINLNTFPEHYVKSHKNNKVKFPFSTNHKIDGKEILTTRFYPTTITLAFICNFLNNAKVVDILDKSEFWKTISNDIKVNSGVLLSERQICHGAVAISETKPNVRCPEAIVEYMTKRNMSYSLPDSNWNKIGESHDIIELDSLSNFKSSLGDNDVKEIQAQPVRSKFGLIADLRGALTTHKNKKALKHPEIINNITECLDIDTANIALHEKILVHWLLTFLKAKKSPNTAVRYFSAIGALWIIHAEQVSEEQPYTYFEDLYLGMLELSSSEKSRSYMKGRLIDLHRFAVTHYNFPKLLTLSKSNDKAIAHVRASFIPESIFESLLGSINQCKTATKQETLLISILLIITYRAGLRLGEVLKLKRSDFEYSPDGWLFIRNNVFDNNKSAAARRKIPLISLLTPGEVQLFKEYLTTNNIIDSLKKGSNKLLFSFAINEATPIDKFMVSNLVSQVLKEISQLTLFVFHCLRHSAFSRLQLLIHYDEFNIRGNLSIFKRDIIPYDDDQIALISLKVFSNNKLKKYNAIAALAGHSSTKMTFNSYFHFTDFIMYCALNMNEQVLHVDHIANISGLSRRSLTLIAQNGKELKINQIKGLLTEKIIKKPFCYNAKLNYIIGISPATFFIKEQNKSVQKFDKIFRILTTIEKGESPEYLMWLYSVPQEVLLNWIEKAGVINSIETEKNKSRHLSSQRSNALITPLPSAQADIDEITLFRANLRKKHEGVTAVQRKNNILKICKIIFCRSTTSNSYILFRHPSTLTFFLKFMSYFPKNRWFISINANKKEDIRLWKIATKGCNTELNIQFTQDKRNPNGQAKVHLLAKHALEKIEQNKLKEANKSPEKTNKNQWKKYSVNTIKFVMHIIAISELSIEYLEEMKKF